jgi:16S rRNA (adenine1518-N6/adenine1519-N6)-dimethyltransferase
MLRQSLRSLGTDTAALITLAGLDPTARAEEVSVEQFVLLARMLEVQRGRR